MKARTVAVLALAALPLAPTLGRAQGDRWERQIQTYLRRTTVALSAQGLQTTGEPQIGLLLVDQSEWFTITLHAGTSYTLIGVCDNDCAGLDLVLYGTGHNELEADRATPVPTIRVTPGNTMPYRVKVTLTSCMMNPCWYGVGAYRKR
ncbi:MAG TPA: hypothetical protein VEK86_11315 [Gemmatimonadales bacterium]|nr:hypothetical protein [Gemmatimonadales bacterium]